VAKRTDGGFNSKENAGEIREIRDGLPQGLQCEAATPGMEGSSVTLTPLASRAWRNSSRLVQRRRDALSWRGEILFDADMELMGAALEPAAATGAEILGLLNFSHAQERAIEIAGYGFAAFGSGELDVIEMCDSKAQALKRITIHNCICICRLGLGRSATRALQGNSLNAKWIERTELVKCCMVRG